VSSERLAEWEELEHVSTTMCFRLLISNQIQSIHMEKEYKEKVYQNGESISMPLFFAEQVGPRFGFECYSPSLSTGYFENCRGYGQTLEEAEQDFITLYESRNALLELDRTDQQEEGESENSKMTRVEVYVELERKVLLLPDNTKRLKSGKEEDRSFREYIYKFLGRENEI